MPHRALVAVVALLVAAGFATGADAARFKVAFTGHDTLVWGVAPGLECSRSGSGNQTIDFADAHPVTVQIRQLHARGHVILVFGPGREGGLVAPGKATVTRVDDTTLAPGACDPMPAKDCGSKSLLHFVPTIWGADSGGFALHGSYWQLQPDAPFDNCLGFQTPKNLAGNGGTYNGWQFGDSIPWRESGDIATRPLSPQKLRVGRTYRFAAHRVIQLTDGDLHGYVMSPNGVAGYLLLGGQTSITDNVSWQITLKRLG